MNNSIHLSSQFVKELLSSDFLTSIFKIGDGVIVHLNKSGCKINNSTIFINMIIKSELLPISSLDIEFELTNICVKENNTIMLDINANGLVHILPSIFSKPLYDKVLCFLSTADINLNLRKCTLRLVDILTAEIPITIKSININNCIDLVWE